MEPYLRPRQSKTKEELASLSYLGFPPLFLARTFVSPCSFLLDTHLHRMYAYLHSSCYRCFSHSCLDGRNYFPDPLWFTEDIYEALASEETHFRRQEKMWNSLKRTAGICPHCWGGSKHTHSKIPFWVAGNGYWVDRDSGHISRSGKQRRRNRPYIVWNGCPFSSWTGHGQCFTSQRSQERMSFLWLQCSISSQQLLCLTAYGDLG